MKTLTADEIIALVKSQLPEQPSFDWKTDFILPKDDDKKGEVLKDLAAVANACVDSCGFIIYGIDPRKPDPILGITNRYDDANLQQLVKGKIEPLPEFLYYEIPVGSKSVGVLQINPTQHRPHIFSVDLGKIRRGQIVVRRGSGTDGITINDLLEFFYGSTSTYFSGVIEAKRAEVERMRELRAQEIAERRAAEIATGMPKGSLGGE